MRGQFGIVVAGAIFVFTGCGGQIDPLKCACVGPESAAEVSSALRDGSQNAVPLKAHGRCVLQYRADGKPHKESFNVKLWVQPPSQIRLNGDVGFNARGIDLGSNEDEFWLAVKPKEISTYTWGKWSEQDSDAKLMVNPKVVLEALGIAQVAAGENWSLAKREGFDVLTKQNEDGTIAKKIHIDCCDRRVAKIEYFDAGKKAVVTELARYKELSESFAVPARIKIAAGSDNGTEESLTINFGSIKEANFSNRLVNNLFTRRPEQKGFEHVFRIIDGEMIEQQQ